MTHARRMVIVVGIAGVALAALVGRSGGQTDNDRSDALRAAIDDRAATNVILMIGDGMGDSEITLARNYAYGASGRMALDDLPFTGQMTTYSVREADPSAPDYTSDSASAATAMATGVKTSDGRISTSARTDQDLETTLELAHQAGLRTGIVTTAEVTDATPAAPMSHVASRTCQGPADMANCPRDAKPKGPGSIAEQSIDHDVDVILGGGKARYDQVVTGGPDAGATVLQQARRAGYAIVTDKKSLAATPGGPILGLFNAGNLASRWTGKPAAKPPSGPQRCSETNPLAANEPDLATMTTAAIQRLEALSRANAANGGRGGFFLQVESASIDKYDHTSQPCEQIGETVNFDEAVAAAIDFAKQDGNTLVIVTADHGHTSQIVDRNSTPAGFSSILITDEGQRMKVAYGTGNTPSRQGHTGTQVRVAAFGPQAANVVGLIDQTDIAAIVKRALRIGP